MLSSSQINHVFKRSHTVFKGVSSSMIKKLLNSEEGFQQAGKESSLKLKIEEADFSKEVLLPLKFKIVWI